MTAPLLVLDEVRKSFHRGGAAVAALDGVSFEVHEGETMGLVGASGAGKTTLAHVVVGLIAPDSGRVRFEGRDLTQLKRSQRRQTGRRLHLVFQDPYAALAPGMSVRDVVAEPLVIQRLPRAEVDRRVRSALADVALLPPAQFMSRLPSELSGGERQRVALARAIVGRPRLIVADEPTAMLDASIRMDLLQTMERLRDDYRVTWVHITHDLALAGAFCDRLTVLDQGRVVESAPTRDLLADPTHARSRALLDAVRELHAALPSPAPGGS